MSYHDREREKRIGNTIKDIMRDEPPAEATKPAKQERGLDRYDVIDCSGGEHCVCQDGYGHKKYAQTPIPIPLAEKSKEELVRIVEMMQEDMEWYVKERNRLIEEAASRVPEPQGDDKGWLIEREGPQWFTGRTWTKDANKAVRFFNREDAEWAIDLIAFSPSEGIKATEHIWMKVQTDFHSVNLATGEKTRSIVGDGQVIHETVAALSHSRAGDAAKREWLEAVRARLDEHKLITHEKCSYNNPCSRRKYLQRQEASLRQSQGEAGTQEVLPCGHDQHKYHYQKVSGFHEQWGCIVCDGLCNGTAPISQDGLREARQVTQQNFLGQIRKRFNDAGLHGHYNLIQQISEEIEQGRYVEWTSVAKPEPPTGGTKL